MPGACIGSIKVIGVNGRIIKTSSDSNLVICILNNSISLFLQLWVILIVWAL